MHPFTVTPLSHRPRRCLFCPHSSLKHHLRFLRAKVLARRWCWCSIRSAPPCCLLPAFTCLLHLPSSTCHLHFLLHSPSSPNFTCFPVPSTFAYLSPASFIYLFHLPFLLHSPPFYLITPSFQYLFLSLHLPSLTFHSLLHLPSSSFCLIPPAFTFTCFPISSSSSSPFPSLPSFPLAPSSQTYRAARTKGRNVVIMIIVRKSLRDPPRLPATPTKQRGVRETGRKRWRVRECKGRRSGVRGEGERGR